MHPALYNQQPLSSLPCRLENTALWLCEYCVALEEFQYRASLGLIFLVLFSTLCPLTFSCRHAIILIRLFKQSRSLLPSFVKRNLLHCRNRLLLYHFVAWSKRLPAKRVSLLKAHIFRPNYPVHRHLRFLETTKLGLVSMVHLVASMSHSAVWFLSQILLASSLLSTEISGSSPCPTPTDVRYLCWTIRMIMLFKKSEVVYRVLNNIQTISRNRLHLLPHQIPF